MIKTNTSAKTIKQSAPTPAFIMTLKNNSLPILLVFFLTTTLGFSQLQATIIDSLTKSPIPYAHIQVEHGNRSYRTNKNGRFNLKPMPSSEILIFSATNYQTKKLSAALIKDTITLTPKMIELDEVVLHSSEKRKKTKLIGKIRRQKIGNYLPGTKNLLYANYFKYQPEYQKTPYLNELKIATDNNNDGTKFFIRLYGVKKNGEPASSIYPNDIIATAKKGKRITKIDLSTLNISFPSEGFFIAVQWLIVKENYAIFDTFDPSIGFTQLETDKNSWYFKKGTWRKIWKNSGEYKHYRNKYNHMALELELSN